MSDDPYAQALLRFGELLALARQSADPEPTAMTLATVSPDGRPSARTVLLKAFDTHGFVFYTHVTSHKGRELTHAPAAALLFHWKHIGHGVQVRIEGMAEAVGASEADTYFASRPRLSQIGAWASLQSETLPQREDFERRIARYEREFDGVEVSRPPHWSGFRVVPARFEFWYGAEFRLHERHVCEQVEGQWRTRMLYP